MKYLFCKRIWLTLWLTVVLSWSINVSEIIDSNVDIRIGTIEVMANTQQVLASPAQTAKPLRLHRPIRVTSFSTGFVYRTLWQYLYEVSRLNGLAFPKQLTVLLSKREGPMASSSTNVCLSPLLSRLTEFCYF